MTETGARFAVAPFEGSVSDLLEEKVRFAPDRVLLTWEGRDITVAEVDAAARGFADLLLRHGIGRDDRVMTLLEPGPNHVAVFFAVAMVGAIWVPQAPDAKGPSLEHVLSVVRPSLTLAAPGAVSAIVAAGHSAKDRLIEIEGWALTLPNSSGLASDAVIAEPDAVRAVLFTSGTTGPPKGVIVTERMILASAAGCAIASQCEAGDVYLMWEPMHHIGGPQLLVMALIHGARLVVVRRFSASGFWPVVRNEGVTKLHYLGGILEILLKAEARKSDKDHPVRLAFGGGARSETRRAFRERFGIPIREVFGMTEASSFTTVDLRDTEGSIGQVLPWMEVAIVSEDGQAADVDQAGQLIVRPTFAGLLTPGYLGDPAATARLLRNGCLYTGDLARRDAEGNYYYLGRMTDSLRRRGENISAWEVETALNSHPDIAESAIVGVPSEIGEADILCFVMMREGRGFDPVGLAEWARDRLPKHHLPRYWKRVEAFERTPSQRIRKAGLNTNLDDAVDLEKM